MSNLKHTTVLLQADKADLAEIFHEEVSKIKHEAFLARFDGIMVNTKEVAKMHGINEKTVLNYIKDGLIVPEMKLNENEHPRFRMSYALTLDFKLLRKQLWAKNKGY